MPEPDPQALNLDQTWTDSGKDRLYEEVRAIQEQHLWTSISLPRDWIEAFLGPRDWSPRLQKKMLHLENMKRLFPRRWIVSAEEIEAHHLESLAELVRCGMGFVVKVRCQLELFCVTPKSDYPLMSDEMRMFFGWWPGMAE